MNVVELFNNLSNEGYHLQEIIEMGKSLIQMAELTLKRSIENDFIHHNQKYFYVELSYLDESLITPIYDKYQINEKRYLDLKNQFNKYNSYKKIEG